jgi:hypothetical protein
VLTVGNVYGHGFDDEQATRLEDLGFVFRPGTSTYAGSQVCHFLDFPVGPSLELIEVTDSSDYESFVPPGMIPYCPGISLVVEAGSPAAFDAYERDFADLEPYRLHVAYGKGRAADAPGRHYLNFSRPVVAGTFVWLTAYDDPTPMPVTLTEHPNGAYGVVGLIVDAHPSALVCLSRLAQSPFTDGELRVGDVWVKAFDGGTAARSFPLRAAVIGAESLTAFPATLRSTDATHLMGRPTLCIETNPSSWDVWVTTV